MLLLLGPSIEDGFIICSNWVSVETNSSPSKLLQLKSEPVCICMRKKHSVLEFYKEIGLDLLFSI